MKHTPLFFGIVVLALPMNVHATETTLFNVLGTFGGLLNVLTPIVVALALLAFFWGLAMYVMNFSGDDKDKKKGRDMMTYGILALFVIVSVWGLVSILQNTFGLEDAEQTKELPYIIPRSQ